MPIALQDIAKRLDVSVATESRALAGCSTIAANTWARVPQTAEEMGYRPNIGFVIPPYSPPSLLSSAGSWSASVARQRSRGERRAQGNSRPTTAVSWNSGSTACWSWARTD